MNAIAIATLIFGLAGPGEIEAIVKRLSADPGAIDELASIARSQSLGTLKRLCNSKSEGVALWAKWQVTIRTAEQMRHVNPLVLARFVGFVEGKTCVECPAWWNAWLYYRCHQPDEPPANIYDALRMPDIPPPAALPKRLEVAFNPDRLSYSIRIRDSNHAPITIARGDASGVAAAINGDMLVIAAYTPFVQYDVECYSIASGKRIWTATGHATRVSASTGTAPVPGTAELIIRGDHVVLFAAGETGNYIECFQLTDGTAKWRFSTEASPDSQLLFALDKDYAAVTAKMRISPAEARELAIKSFNGAGPHYFFYNGEYVFTFRRKKGIDLSGIFVNGVTGQARRDVFDNVTIPKDWIDRINAIARDRKAFHEAFYR
ncbi:MAG: hypothetical protein KDB14_02685 [Planctomycetales bacterium]|nr:hypothetical protein [Planctomycetales bacterium]